MHILRKHIWSPSEIRKGLLVLSLILILLAFPVSAISAVLTWEPLTMPIIQVPIGGTGYQVLTLTNTDAVDPISIDSVEFTYNQQGAYEFTTSISVPGDLLAGQSMDVIFSFSPTIDIISFASADIIVTNSSENAPSLYYSVIGEAIASDPCSPDIFCGGLCVDTQTDVDHCGGCNNECPPVDNGIVFCASGICNFECDEGYEPDSGECVPIGITGTLLERIQYIIEFYNDSRASGSIIGLGPGLSGEQRADVLGDWLVLAETMFSGIQSEISEFDCSFLNQIHLRTDSMDSPPDFVAGENTGELDELIVNLLLEMGCTVGHPSHL